MGTTVTFAAALGALLTFGACGLEPSTPIFEAEPNESTLPALVEADVADPERAAARIAGQMEFLFGSLENPGFYVLDEWAEEYRDPSNTWWELSDRAVDAVRAGNDVRFAAQIDALERLGDADEPQPVDVPPVRGIPWERWRSEFAELIEGEVALGALHPDSPELEDASEDDPTFTWADEAHRFWRSYYPSLEESAELYRVRCLTCHGPMGGGNGPTGRWLDPEPRDLRDGIFKWTSVQANYRPRRGDLIEVLERGVRGTAMPSFRRYSRGELEGLVDWIRYLAIRGETEQLATYFVANSGAVRMDDVMKAYETTWARWDEATAYSADAPDVAPRPDGALAGRIARGAELFRGELANCATCHGENGRGDGEAIWEVAENDERIRRLDRWGHPSHPRDLTSGVFRGGERPADLFRRIKYGIGGTIMPAADASLSDDDIWSLVDFVFSLGDGADAASEERDEPRRSDDERPGDQDA